MHVEEKCLAVLDEAVGVAEVGLALADGLDLSAAQGDARLNSLNKKVVMGGGAILNSVSLPACNGVTRTRRFAGRCRVAGHYDMSVLARQRRLSSIFHRSICRDRRPVPRIRSDRRRIPSGAKAPLVWREASVRVEARTLQNLSCSCPYEAAMG